MIILHLQTNLEVKEDLHCAQFLIIKNPKWGFSLIDINDNGATTETLDTLVNTSFYFSLFERRGACIVELIYCLIVAG